MTKNKSRPLQLHARISADSSVYIRALDDSIAADQSVYALNWFDERSGWLYDLYNWLAAASVRKVGGRPFFKGRVQQVLYGEPPERRETLLIVRYPALTAFRDMLQNRYFQLVSLLRLLAVKRFTFAFSRRLDEAGDFSADDARKVYALHFYRGESSLPDAVLPLASEYDIRLRFAGRVKALLWYGDTRQLREQVPNLMQVAMLYEADSVGQLRQMIVEPRFEELTVACEATFIATLNAVSL